MFFKASLEQLYLEDKRPWLVGFSGGKDSTMLASLICDAALPPPVERAFRPVYRLLSTLIPIPAITEMIEGALDRMRECSQEHGLSDDLLNMLKDALESRPRLT